jgi:FKBP-type peptidyl-prolyl cis-trans isomerase
MIESEHKTKMGQRIAILSIAALLLLSTVALYVMIVLSSNNDRKEAQLQQEEQAKLQLVYEEYQSKVDEQRLGLSSQYLDKFVGYKSEVKAYNAAAVTELGTRDLAIGDGEEIGESTEYSAYYIGWLPDETIFDSSLEEGDISLKSPIAGGGLIDGWNQGVIGMKIGGVREITIPSELGYGEAGQGDIPANSPLKFVVMVIPKVEEIPIPAELLTSGG